MVNQSLCFTCGKNPVDDKNLIICSECQDRLDQLKGACPECHATQFNQACRCPVNDKLCINNHWSHMCNKHSKRVPGRGPHGIFMMDECTCAGFIESSSVIQESHPIPEPTIGFTKLSENPVLGVDSYSVAEWSSKEVPGSKPEAVLLMFQLGNLPVGVRITSKGELKRLVKLLEKHGENVWPEAS